VKENLRDNGIGQQLFDAIKQYFISQNCASLRLKVLSDNHQAITFYQKNGLQPHELEMIMPIRNNRPQKSEVD
jgi:ribosomal protein S18 acetylase RimI-like enzyme